MSFWWQRNENGNTHYYAFPFAPMVLLIILGIVVAMILPAIQAVRAWFSG
jgi:hypothetical protein